MNKRQRKKQIRKWYLENGIDPSKYGVKNYGHTRLVEADGPTAPLTVEAFRRAILAVSIPYRHKREVE